MGGGKMSHRNQNNIFGVRIEANSGSITTTVKHITEQIGLTRRKTPLL